MTNSADPDQLASSWLLQKPTDLDLHCLLRQGMSCSARDGLTTAVVKIDTEKEGSFRSPHHNPKQSRIIPGHK